MLVTVSTPTLDFPVMHEVFHRQRRRCQHSGQVIFLNSVHSLTAIGTQATQRSFTFFALYEEGMNSLKLLSPGKIPSPDMDGI